MKLHLCTIKLFNIHIIFQLDNMLASNRKLLLIITAICLIAASCFALFLIKRLDNKLFTKGKMLRISPGGIEDNCTDILFQQVNQVRIRHISSPGALNEKYVEPMPTSYPIVQGGEDRDPSIRQKRNHIRQMMKHAWDGYARHAWGMNELKPISQTSYNDSAFRSEKLGATIVDSMDTLYIMQLMDEFEKGKDWIRHNLNFTGVTTELSVFETNIRFVGGLLSLFSITGDTMFLDKAHHIANKLLPAFDTPTGIPKSLIDISTGKSQNYPWTSKGSSILSEFGTLSLEFNYLSDVVGSKIFKEKITNIMDKLKKIKRADGLYSNYVNPKTGSWASEYVSMGSMGDSFYEYLLKSWLQNGKTDVEMRDLYVDAMDAVMRKLVHTSKNGLVYLASINNGRLEHKMEHLTCFSAAMLALGSVHLPDPVSNQHMQLASEIVRTCHESYNRSWTKLGPDVFHFDHGVEATSLVKSEAFYILRPEVVESYFVMWRLTHDTKYREWGWEVVRALEEHCRVHDGYSGIKNVYACQVEKDDVMQSFFPAETLKYLYLLFSDDNIMSLDKWVFNTEAHPLPIKGANAFYRA